MKPSILVTVVIPVYNVEKYLDRCLESIVNQTYENLEIILVDDGSPDRCPQLCDEWAKKDSRIKVIHKENAGLGYARNSGIDIATGDYIYFIDSDDYIDNDTISKCMEVALTYNVDIVQFGYNKVLDTGKITDVKIPCPPKNLYEDEDVIYEFLVNALGRNPHTGLNWNLSLSACFSLFSMDLIKRANFKFVSERDIISEDYYSMLDLYASVKRVAVIPKPYYYYRTNNTSLTQVYREDRLKRIDDYYQKSLNLCIKKGYPDIVKNQLWKPYYGNIIGHLKILMNSHNTVIYKVNEIRKIITDDTLSYCLSNKDLSSYSFSVKLLLIALKHKSVFTVYILLLIRKLKREK